MIEVGPAAVMRQLGEAGLAADIAAYDANHDHMLMSSDMLTDGTVRQFPAKFSTAAGVPVRSRAERG